MVNGYATMSQSRASTALVALGAAIVGGAVAVLAATLLMDVFVYTTGGKIWLTPNIRYAVMGLAVLGVVPATLFAVFGVRRRSTDSLHRRLP